MQLSTLSSDLFSADELNNILSKFSQVEMFEQYFHRLVDGWLLRGERPKYSTYANETSMELEQWWRLDELITTLAQKHVNEPQHDDKELKTILSDVKLGDVIIRLLNTRKNDLIGYFKLKSNNFTHTLLKDFDWSVKLATSSDKVSKLNTKLCTLDLFVDDNIDNNVNNQTSIKNIEMNKEELDAFIAMLETIQQKMEVFDD